MKKRLSGKLLAVILAFAICATTVLGCLMTVSAADPCYAFSKGEFDGDDLTEATIDVTFTAPANLPDGFSAGQFSWEEVSKDDADCLELKSVTAVTDGVNLADNEGDFYLFDLDEAKSSVTFKFTFGFSAGEASLTGKEYKITLNEVELANSDNAYYIERGNAYGIISAGCKHVVTGVGTPIATGVGGDYGYSVYAQSVCTICGEQFGYQLVPTAESLNDSDAILPTEVDVFEGRTELATKYDKNGDASADASDSANWVLDCEGTPHRTWGYIDADIKLLDETKENSEENPYIIENAEQLFYIVKIGGSKTAGKYYKVKDGIRAFHLNPNVTDETSFEDMMANIGKSGANWDSAAAFQGHFDGNGVIITGIRTTTNHAYSGLFPQITGNVTIKNVTIMNSYLIGRTAVGGFFGTQVYDSSKGEVYDITIENCAIYQCYMQSTHSSNGVGAIGGFVSNACNPGTGWINGDTIVNNCYVNLDEEYFISTTETSGTGSHGGAIGYQGSSVMNVTNSIFIGIRPYTARNLTGDKISGNFGWQAAKATCYNNVYTTHPCDDAYNSAGAKQDFTGRIFTLTDAQFKGQNADLNMLTLDFDTVWATTNSYPTLYMPYNRPEAPTNIIYWDGTVASGIAEGTGAKDDPYIINTVAEFAYAVGQTRANYAITDGKYFKLAEGIDTIVLQPKALAKQIMALDSAAEVKSFFESATGLLAWKYYGWEVSTFCGNIDFNGATIYGGYIKDSGNNAALISNIDAGAVISNLALKNCYFTSASGSYQVGAIAAVTNGATYGKSANGFIWFNNCTVANNYLYNSSTDVTRSGVFLGASSDIVYVDNCLAYGNDATYGSGDKMSLYSCANNSVLVSSAPAIPDGLNVVDDGAETARYYNIVRNSIFMGFNPINVADGFGSRSKDLKGYVNCYTDSNVDTDVDKNGKTALQYFYVDTTAPYITKIAAADAKGAAAETNMPNLTWGTDWYVGAEGEYPAQAPFVEVGVAKQSNPDFTIAGTNLVYEDDGSFSMNIHYIPAYEGFAPTMYVGNESATKLYILDTPVASSKRAEIGDNTAMMFTLKGISAKNIESNWYPTLVAQQGASVEWSKSAAISVAETARATIAGDYDTADKNVAAAVLMYGGASVDALNIKENDYVAGTIDLLEFGQYLVDAGSTSKYYDTNVADNGETGTANDPIIIDTAEEFVYLAKASGDDTKGKYYKVADGIAGFDLSKGNLDYSKGFAENKTAIKSGGKNHAGGTPGFQGYFDGNGVTVYGAWSNHEQISSYVGLFSCTKGDVTIKNVNVRLSSFTGKSAVGGIVGYHTGDGTNTLTIENCSVAESEIVLTGAPAYGSGVAGLVGYSANLSSWKEADKQIDGNGDGDMTDTIYVNGKTIINNCYVNFDPANVIGTTKPGVLTDTSKRGTYGGFVGFMTSNGLTVNNSYAIGITPYAVQVYTGGNDVQHTGLPEHFNNVYTDMGEQKVALGGSLGTRDFTGRVHVLTKDKMTGIAAKNNMTALDWNTVWTTTDSYPTFISTAYKAPASGATIYWDGTVASGIATGTGTKEDPYIIKTAAEFAWLVKNADVDGTASTSHNSTGKYYEIDEAISTIVLQPEANAEDIIALGSAAEVKAYFETGSHVEWIDGAWEATSFAGNFDGNGATVYGLYSEAYYNAGLFSTIDAGAVIKNISVKNSYFKSTSGSYQVAAIAPVGSSTSYGAKTDGVMWMSNITVANNYMYNASTSIDRTGVLAGSLNDALYLDNILVYGNDATYGTAGAKAPLVNGAKNNVVTDVVPEGLVTKVDGGSMHYNMVRNSIILGCAPYDTTQATGSRFNDLNNCYENVYTDADIANDTFSNGTAASGIKGATQVTDLATLKGDAAQSVVDTFNTANGSTVWYVGTTGDYPGFEEAGVLNSGLQAIYDGITLEPDTYNNTGIDLFSLYATSVNLNSNPYISFAFEFGGELKGKQDQITVTFTYTVNGTEYTYTTTPPASVDSDGDGVIDEINNVNGWYNRASAGRFFTYRFKDIPVEALANPIQVSANYNGTDYDLGTVSVGGLAYEFECQNKLTPSDYYATRIETVKALLFYTQMIHARYGAQ